jgi:hypothetical protein
LNTSVENLEKFLCFLLEKEFVQICLQARHKEKLDVDFL